MPLFPDQPFAEGAAFTPELAYLAFNAPVFDDQSDYLGHREKLQDSELSDQPGAIKQRLNAIENSLLCTASDGLVVAYEGGQVVMPDGSIEAIAPGQISVPDNATSLIYLTVDATVEVSSTAPNRRLLMASVETSGGAISLVRDLRSAAYRKVAPVARSVRSFGGSNNDSKTCTNGEILDSGLYFFKNFTVPSGVAITVDRYAKIVCSGDVDIAGTITVTPLAPGAQAQPYNLTFTGSTGQAGGFGLGSNGKGYPWGAQQHGSGGRQGELQNPLSTEPGHGTSGAGGDGGGALVIEASGTITVTGSIYADGSAGEIGRAEPNKPALISGAGGGSGGLILLASLRSVTATGSATLSVRGGDGAPGYAQRATNNQVALGGNGAGGGYIVIMAPEHSTGPAQLRLGAGDKGAPVNRSWSGNTLDQTGATMLLGGGVAGGYGGKSGTTITAGATITHVPGEPGKVVFRTFTPIS